jgi:hypothetical protein
MVCALSEVKTLSERSRTGIVDIQLGDDCSLVSPEMIVFESRLAAACWGAPNRENILDD